MQPGEAALVAQLFDWYLEPQATLHQPTARLADLGGGHPDGQAALECGQRAGHFAEPGLCRPGDDQSHPGGAGRRRKSALRPAGAGLSHAPRPEQDWIEVPVPPVVSAETFARVQAKLAAGGHRLTTPSDQTGAAQTMFSAARLAAARRTAGWSKRYGTACGRAVPFEGGELVAAAAAI